MHLKDAIFWICVVIRLHHCIASILSASKLEACTEGDVLECDEKIVVALTLESGQLTTERMEATLDTAESDDGEEKELATPVKIEWTKESAFWRYPLVYIQNVNREIKEQIIHTGTCYAEPGGVDYNTCGFWKTEEGRTIQDSEGFCCTCGLFFETVNGRTTRGQIDCGEVFTGLTTQSGHCLRLDDLWYAVFDIVAPIMEYEISIFVTINNTTEVISLKHTDVVGQTEELKAGGLSKHVLAELVGDFATAQATPLYEDKYLVVPATPGHEMFNATGNMLTYGMLIPKTAFDLTGTTCDKIGISHNGFINQPQRCTRRPFDCLQFQIKYYHDLDEERARNGQPMLYRISNQCNGGFQLQSQKSEETQVNEYELRCAVSQRHTTLIRLEVAADNMRFVSSLAQGFIHSMEVLDFEAMSGAGEITAVVNSTAQRPAEFVLGVECSDGVAPGPAPRFSLAPGTSDTKQILLHSGSGQEAVLNCTLSLKDIQGTQLDTASVEFSITQMEAKCGAQCGAADGDDVTTVFIEPDLSCPCSFVAIWCQILHLKLCYKKLLMWLLVFGGGPGLLYLAYMGKLSFLFKVFKKKKPDARESIRRRTTIHRENEPNRKAPYAERVRRSYHESKSASRRYESIGTESTSMSHGSGPLPTPIGRRSTFSASTAHRRSSSR